mgnify:FL=1
MKKYRHLSILLIVILLLFLSNSLVFANEHQIINEKTVEKINDFKNEVGSITNIFLAFASITSVLIFIIHFIRLANSYDHPFTRRKVLNDIGTTAIVTGLIGAIGLITKLFIGIYM